MYYTTQGYMEYYKINEALNIKVNIPDSHIHFYQKLILAHFTITEESKLCNL